MKSFTTFAVALAVFSSTFASPIKKESEAADSIMDAVKHEPPYYQQETEVTDSLLITANNVNKLHQNPVFLSEQESDVSPSKDNQLPRYFFTQEISATSEDDNQNQIFLSQDSKKAIRNVLKNSEDVITLDAVTIGGEAGSNNFESENKRVTRDTPKLSDGLTTIGSGAAAGAGIGAAIAGPPGAIIGAEVGAWAGLVIHSIRFVE